MFPHNLPKVGQMVTFTLTFTPTEKGRCEFLVTGRRMYETGKMKGFIFHLGDGTELIYRQGDSVEWVYNDPKGGSPVVSDVAW
jgi:hypothetical protein